MIILLVNFSFTSIILKIMNDMDTCILSAATKKKKKGRTEDNEHARFQKFESEIIYILMIC